MSYIIVEKNKDQYVALNKNNNEYYLSDKENAAIFYSKILARNIKDDLTERFDFFHFEILTVDDDKELDEKIDKLEAELNQNKKEYPFKKIDVVTITRTVMNDCSMSVRLQTELTTSEIIALIETLKYSLISNNLKS